MRGNGAARKKIARKAPAAMATWPRVCSARRPTRTTASTTIASTAGFNPANAAVSHAVWPKVT